jgi:hypothetical protein
MRIRTGLGVLICCCAGLAACTAAAPKGPDTTVTTPSVETMNDVISTDVVQDPATLDLPGPAGQARRPGPARHTEPDPILSATAGRQLPGRHSGVLPVQPSFIRTPGTPGWSTLGHRGTSRAS